MAKGFYADWDDHDVYVRAPRPARRTRRRSVPWLRLTLLSAACVAGLVFAAKRETVPSGTADPGGVAPAALVAPAPVWRPVAPALFALERSAIPAAWEARQHSNGAREDTLTLGRFGEGRHARITLVQGSADPVRSFYVDLVRRAADAGLAVARSGQARAVVTKFGAIEAAPVSLIGASEQACQGIRFADEASGFAFQGWVCGAPDDGALACLVDGIALSGAGAPSLKALFVQVERNRLEACGAAPRVSAAPGKPQRP